MVAGRVAVGGLRLRQVMFTGMGVYLVIVLSLNIDGIPPPAVADERGDQLPAHPLG